MVQLKIAQGVHIKAAEKCGQPYKSFILECKMSYTLLRTKCKTHFIERHLFKPNIEAIQFQTKLCHHFSDCMATMKSDMAHVMKFDEEEFNRHYSKHLETAAKTRIHQLFEDNFFRDHNGGRCEFIT